jgi:nucleotide-binding universal stress UspA family protein
MMVGFKRVLIPIDFSHVSPVLVPYAKTLGLKFESEIHLLYVARNMEHLASIEVSRESIERCQSELLDGAQKRMREFVETYFHDYPVADTRIVTGEIVEEILKYAKAKNIDLVILGTHGRQGMERAIFGSVVERVIMSSPLPVLVVNPYKERMETP